MIDHASPLFMYFAAIRGLNEVFSSENNAYVPEKLQLTMLKLKIMLFMTYLHFHYKKIFLKVKKKCIIISFLSVAENYYWKNMKIR